MSWEDFEKTVRGYAEFLWGTNSEKGRISGVNLDCILKKDNQEWIIIEITQNNTLNKIRDDITKIKTACQEMMQKLIICRAYIVCDFEPTQGMKDAGKSGDVEFVKVLSLEKFVQQFFNFKMYQHARELMQFGSAIDPSTGEQDKREYIPVTYINETLDTEISFENIVSKLKNNEKIVLLGDYGTGKSRCFYEIFRHMSSEANETFLYPIAINLRDAWGLQNPAEIIRRHFKDLGLRDEIADNVVKTFRGNNFCFLLDGFDEIGSRPWGESSKKLEALRQEALRGIKELIQNTKSSVIISGRAHYFNGNEEMYKALGLTENANIISCKSEFSETEYFDFLDKNNISHNIPKWLPRKPLILKVITELSEQECDELFDESLNSETIFWNRFIDYICQRDARIRNVLDEYTIKQVLIGLSRVTRFRSDNIGPISEQETFNVFHEVTKKYPNEEETVMLQRLPGLGRIGSFGGDRNFVDGFVLDGLRALDVYSIISNIQHQAMQEPWLQPLRSLGIKILSSEVKNRNLAQSAIKLSENIIDNDHKNKVLASDIIAMLAISSTEHNYSGRVLHEPIFGILDLENCQLNKIKLQDGLIEELILSKKLSNNIGISRCIIQELVGVSSEKGVPNWLDGCQISNFKIAATLASMKKDLSKAQTILVSILIKIYRQRGNGRMEHTLMKGLAHVDRVVLHEIMDYLIRELVIIEGKDNSSHEKIYKPNRKFQYRVEQILTELDTSNDDIWRYASFLQ